MTGSRVAYPADGKGSRAKRGGMYDGFISYRLKGTGGGKHPVVTMATEPAPCELDVYLNARELRDVIFTPLFCRPLTVPRPVACLPPPRERFRR